MGEVVETIMRGIVEDAVFGYEKFPGIEIILVDQGAIFQSEFGEIGVGGGEEFLFVFDVEQR